MSYRKVMLLLLAGLLALAAPWSVFANEEEALEMISSAEETVETVLPVSITGGR